MPFQVRVFPCFAVVLALALLTGARIEAQSAAAPAGSQTTSSTPYISVNPLANVRYDNRFDASLALAYDHMKAGPNLLQGSNLGGLDLSGSLWLSRHWGVQSSIRAYVGTSGTAPNHANSNGGPIKGPFVAQYFAVAGPEFLGPHNKHGALIAHVLVGGVYGDFERDLLSPTAQNPNPAEAVGFYNDQIAPAVIMGGHFDLNRSEHWVFRLTPDAVMTHYGTNYGAKISQYDINAAFSVGMEYKFTSIRR